VIGTLIPDIINHLKDSGWAFQKAGALALSKLSDHSKGVNFKLSDLISLIGFIAEFQMDIRTAVPMIIALLKDNDKSVQKASIDALSKLSEHSKSHHHYFLGLALLISIYYYS
jgi:hypothetical protein